MGDDIKLENAWPCLAYSPLGVVVAPPANTNETHLMIAPTLLLNVPEVTTEKISTPTVQLLMSQTPGSQTESHQISTRCTDITADYSAEIKIVIIQSVLFQATK